MSPAPAARPVASLVIPAHDEERTLGRLLDAVCATPGQFEVAAILHEVRSPGCSLRWL